VVGSAHPCAVQASVSVDQLRRQPLIAAAGEDEPAVVVRLRTLLGEDAAALDGATVARDVHTITGLAACGVGVGLGPARTRAAPRPGIRFCEVTPETALPALVLSFADRDRSPVLNAFLGTAPGNCPDVGAALDRRPGHAKTRPSAGPREDTTDGRAPRRHDQRLGHGWTRPAIGPRRHRIRLRQPPPSQLNAPRPEPQPQPQPR
jgi:hypothetical protein